MNSSAPAGPRRRRSAVQPRAGSLLLAAGVAALVLAGFVASPAGAATTCDPGADVCSVQPDSVQTPAGVVTATVSATNVVTVQMAPTSPSTLMFGIPFAVPPGPPCRVGDTSCGLPGYARTSIATAGGLVTIDTVVWPAGRFQLPSLVVVSIHPPSPCRVRTTGSTVVFTPVAPVIPPGPPA